MLKIKNDRQLAATKKWRADFQEALAKARQNSRSLHPRLHQAQVDGIRSQIKDLDTEIAEYQALRRSLPERIVVNSLEDLPGALVRLRITRRLTQDELAQRLGVKPQQVQRWEAGAYQRATYATICKVADVLKIDLKGKPAK